MTKHSTTITIEDKKIQNHFVEYAEICVAYWSKYWPEETEMGHVREPAHLEIEACEEGSYVDSDIYLISKDKEEIKLDPKKTPVQFRIIEKIIIAWVVENETALIEESINDDAAEAAEYHAEMMSRHKFDRRY